ncbi:unnamed protein product [Microthlaspi erraticum]|uniref:Uncharacterized protein n=1 Tax=Microthlaspi erraticum TaxID=1685480 RepID=A0A6D2HIP0_9BRAS|nr:unnamed protein product [Microthlaspi erraticum]
MAKELTSKAHEAFVDGDLEIDVDLYSKVIELDPNCADFFADRVQANIKLLNFTEEALLTPALSPVTPQSKSLRPGNPHQNLNNPVTAHLPTTLRNSTKTRHGCIFAN